MNCNDARKLIDDMLEGRLGRAGAGLISEHCTDCASCRKAVDEAEALMRVVSDSFKSARPAKTNRKRIMSAVTSGQVNARRRSSASYFSSTPVIAAMAAAAAVLLVIGIIALSEYGAQPRRRTASTDRRKVEGTDSTPTGDSNAAEVAMDDAAAPKREPVIVDEPGEAVMPSPVPDTTAPPEVVRAPEAPTGTPEPAPTDVALNEAVGSILSGDFEIKRRGDSAMKKAEGLTELRPGDVIALAGEQAGEVKLSDKVTLAVDAGSKITVGDDPEKPFDLRLNAGQLFADVETGTPFRVFTADGIVNCLGTKFAVSLADSNEGGKELQVTVEEGVVQVERESERHIVKGGKCVSFRRGHGMANCSPEMFRRRMMWVQRFRAMHGHGRGHGHGPCRFGSMKPGHKHEHGKPGEGNAQGEGEHERGRGPGGKRPGMGDGQGMPGRGRGPGWGPGRGGAGGRRR